MTPPEAPDPSPQPKRDSKLVAGLKYTHIAFALPGGVIAGWLLGSLMDRWLGTTKLHLIGLVLGIVVGFYDLVRTFRRMSRDTDVN